MENEATLSKQDKEALDNAAMEFCQYADNVNEEFWFDDDAYPTFKSGAEWGIIYERNSNASLQSEIDRLQKVSGEDDIKILTLEDHVRNLESEIDRLKEENKALIEALITCSKEDDKYSYIVARCTLKNYNHPH